MQLLKYYLFLILFSFLACKSLPTPIAPSVDPKQLVQEVAIQSDVMNKFLGARIILPKSYFLIGTKAYPVLYLLHGYSDDFKAWTTKAAGLAKLSSQYDIIIVTPDGGYSSWYLDSPIDSTSQFETHITKEVVTFVDQHYRTLANPAGRAITGLSMGGHGGMYLGLKHQDIFGAMGSMSGGVDIRPFPEKWEIKDRIGSKEEFSENWEKYTVINNLDLINPEQPPQIIIDCGVGDFFFEVNQNLHQELLNRKIPHEFTARPGIHDWNYWANAIKFQVLFFNEFFKKGI